MGIEVPTISQGPADAGPKLYRPETPPEKLSPEIVPETRQEILKILTEPGWQEAKDWVQESPDAPLGISREARIESGRSYATGYLEGAVLMREFDPVRASREVQVADDDWGRYRDTSRNRFHRSQFRYAAALKELDPERYGKEKPLSDTELDDAFPSFSGVRVQEAAMNEHDVQYWHQFRALAPERFQQLIEGDDFRRNVWPGIKRSLDYKERHRTLDARDTDTRTIELVALRGLLQNMRPPGEPPFSMTKAEWGVLQHELGNILQRRNAPLRFFYLANAASRLPIVG